MQIADHPVGLGPYEVVDACVDIYAVELARGMSYLPGHRTDRQNLIPFAVILVRMPTMRTKNIDSVNLNLVPALAALLEERHVTRAADRVGLSQPAMSHVLKQLRQLFSDELLVRGPDGYTLTPRAERIHEHLATVVTQLQRLFATESFDPAVAAQSFRLAASDYMLSTLGAELVQVILTQSPNSTVVCEPVDELVFDRLDTGILDLLIYGRPPPGRYCSEHLFDDRYVCVVAADHPIAGRTSLSLTQYLRWPHMASKLGGQVLDKRLAGREIARKIAVTMPYHVLAANVLPGTQLVLTVPERFVRYLGDPAPIRVVPAPPELGELHYYLVWHRRVDDDPSQQWLRNLVQSAAAPKSEK
ncbi:MAG: LysR family transcriptional regulator [Mycolicibacterium sp.]|uniref:LysR family transcriptional regulator n=1 Tax=Mycolicibacterium sp. TaxID=2320850 RepID=UPI003D14A016